MNESQKMNDLYDCNSLDDIKNWLKVADLPAKNGEFLLFAEFERLKNYQNALEWNQLVLVCEAINILGWHRFVGQEPVEADCYKGMSGSWETVLRDAQWEKQAGSWRDWSKLGDSFMIYKGTDSKNYGVQKLNSQRIALPTNPFKMGQYSANCQKSVEPLVAEMKNLRAMLDAEMRPAEYGDDFYVTRIFCSFSNHDDVYETVRTEYFHAKSDIPANCQSAYVSVKPHIEFGKLSSKRDKLCWKVEMYFSRAWGEVPLTKQKQAFKTDLEIIFAEFEARIAKKKLRYKAKQATTDAMQIINKWLAA
jgi:hypothetical protein